MVGGPGRPDDALLALTQLLRQLGEMGGKDWGQELGPKQAARLAQLRGEAWGEVARCFLAKVAPQDALEAGDRFLHLCPWSPQAYHIKGRIFQVRLSRVASSPFCQPRHVGMPISLLVGFPFL